MLGKRSGKHAVKKTTAVVLAAAVLGMAVPVCSPQETMAASKVSVAASKKLKAGQSYQLKLKNAADWTVQGAKTENKKIVKITRQSKKAVTVSAVRAGWCDVTVTAKNSGNGKTKKLTCRIQVGAGVKREVSTQAQLNAALKKKDTEQITINNTTQETSYQIPAGTYSNVALIVKAGGAKVTNNGTFGSVTIQSAKKGGSWTENAKGNSLRVTSTVSKIVVNKGAKVANLSLEKAGMDTQLEIKGRVSKVNVNGANTKLAISGSTASVVPITVKKAASGSEITASVQVRATVKAKKVQITINKGAEESTIKAIRVRTEVVNNSDGNVVVIEGDRTLSLASGKKMTTAISSNVGGDVDLALNIPLGAVSYNGHSYFCYKLLLTWEKAEEYCESQGGHLATITSQEENDFIYKYITEAGYSSAYFGFNDVKEEGVWRWGTGEKVEYTNWHQGEPNYENSGEDYAMFYYKYVDGTWNDGNCAGLSEEIYICEWDT